MKAICHFCETIFKNKQAVRAHQRWCQPYLAGKAPKPIDRHASLEQHTHTTLRPHTQRQRLLVINIHDHLRMLLELCIAHTKLSKVLNCFFAQEEDWRTLLYDVHELTELTRNMLVGIHPMGEPLALYEQVFSVRTRWMRYRLALGSSSSCEEGQISEETLQQTGITEEQQLLEQLMGHLKELVSLTPP